MVTATVEVGGSGWPVLCLSSGGTGFWGGSKPCFYWEGRPKQRGEEDKQVSEREEGTAGGWTATVLGRCQSTAGVGSWSASAQGQQAEDREGGRGLSMALFGKQLLAVSCLN